MAIGTISNMTVFDQQFYGGFMDQVQTKLDIFNANSGNTMRLNAMFHRGWYEEEAFFSDDIVVQHRNEGSTAAVTPNSLSSSTVKKAKSLKHITVQQTLQSFRNQGMGEDEIAFRVGQKAGQRIIEEWREAAVSALVGAYQTAALQAGGGDELVYDISQVTSGGVMNTQTLIAAMPLFGDARSRLKAIVMHSDVYWPMVADAAANLATPVTADFAVQQGLPATLGLPVIVVDSPSLVVAAGGADGQNAYYSFILVEGAVTVTESEAPFTESDKDLLSENASRIYKTEFAYSTGLKGVSYTGANDNPTLAELAAAASWTKRYASKRDLMGIAILSVAVANDATP